ncbi:hypothetical protein BKA70DRAFT_1427149 [Coprinopsis sp. MPI-PUGE-AT-0042]|nr:hypothetical protein BKA70DRAFT_1427149 [Coprinopsis sp. MPI-PUGE-AT-0042]
MKPAVEKVKELKSEQVAEDELIQSKKAEDDGPQPKLPGKRKPLPRSNGSRGKRTFNPAICPSTDVWSQSQRCFHSPHPLLLPHLPRIAFHHASNHADMQHQHTPGPVSALTLPSSSSFSFPASPLPPLTGTSKESYASSVWPRAGLSNIPPAKVRCSGISVLGQGLDAPGPEHPVSLVTGMPVDSTNPVISTWRLEEVAAPSKFYPSHGMA